MSTLVLLAALAIGQQQPQVAITSNAPVYQVYLVRNEYNQYVHVYVQVQPQPVVDYVPLVGWALFADEWGRDRHRYDRRRWFQR